MKEPIEIRDPAIDTLAILQRLYANREKQHLHLESELPDFDLPPLPEVDDVTLHYHLHQVNALYDSGWVDLMLAPSPVAHIPVIGKVWGLLREQFHRLILYYVEMAVSKQIGFNLHLASVVNRLAVMQTEIAILREETSALRQQLIERTN